MGLSVEQKINEMITAPVQGLGLNRWHQFVRRIHCIYIDSEDGINVDDCVMNHQVMPDLGYHRCL